LKGKIYLDTSVISALFDERTTERMAQTKQAWSVLEDYEVAISSVVLDELSNATRERRADMLSAVSNFSVLTVTDEAEALADEYIRTGIFPEKYRDDAVHVAIATTNGITILLSWNFTHLVKVKTRHMVALINASKNYMPVEIISPPEL
jgi:predicted nucleic acid-binding protein